MATNAKYITHPNPELRGNPLIEGLGYPLGKKAIQERCNKPFQGDLDLSEVPEELHGYYTRSVIGNLFDVRVCQDEMVEVYEVIRQSIESGYRQRNPLSKAQNRLLSAIQKDSDEPMMAQHLDSLDLFNASYSYLICGLSGRGKTSMIAQALAHIEQVISHEAYPVDAQTVVPFRQTQITYIYVQHHDRRGQKALLSSILEAIDEATGEQYAHQHRNSTVKKLITAVRKAVVVHCIATVIIDEAQNFAPCSTEIKIGTNEKTSMKFVEELFNSIGTSLIFVGTFSTLELFSKELTITRRTIRCGSMALASCPADGSFWKRLCREILRTNLLAGESEPIDTLRLHLHYLSAGIPAIAVSVVQATLAFLTFHAPHRQQLTTRALDYVYNQQFKLLKEPVQALHNGDYHKFEDLKPMLMLEEVNALDKSEQQKVALEQKALEMEALLHQQKSKLMHGAVVPAPTQLIEPAATLDAVAESDSLAPESFLDMLGDS